MIAKRGSSFRERGTTGCSREKLNAEFLFEPE